MITRLSFITASFKALFAGAVVQSALPDDQLIEVSSEGSIMDPPHYADLTVPEEQEVTDYAFMTLTDTTGDLGELMRIDVDGRLVFGENVRPKEAAEQFAEWVNEFVLGRKPPTRIVGRAEDFDRIKEVLAP